MTLDKNPNEIHETEPTFSMCKNTTLKVMQAPNANKTSADFNLKPKKAKVVDESDLIPKSVVPPVLKLLFKVLFALIIFALNLALGITGFLFFTTLFSVLPNYIVDWPISTRNSTKSVIDPDLLKRPIDIIYVFPGDIYLTSHLGIVL